MYKQEQNLLPLVICPACKKAQFYPRTGRDSVSCPGCGKKYPIVNGYLDLLLVMPGNVPEINASMDWGWVAKIYNFMIRQGLIAYFLTGISFKKEKEKILKAAELKEEDSVLDLACGPGTYSRFFARKVKRGWVTGFDLSEVMLSAGANIARRKKLENLLFLRGNAMDLPLGDESFNLVNCCGALHLFPEIEKVINSVYRVLKPGGRFTGATFKKADNKYLIKWEKLLVKKGLNCRSPETIESLLRERGFVDIRFLHKKRIWQIFSARKG